MLKNADLARVVYYPNEHPTYGPAAFRLLSPQINPDDLDKSCVLYHIKSKDLKALFEYLKDPEVCKKTVFYPHLYLFKVVD
jgi:hypothetical protein